MTSDKDIRRGVKRLNKLRERASKEKSLYSSDGEAESIDVEETRQAIIAVRRLKKLNMKINKDSEVEKREDLHKLLDRFLQKLNYQLTEERKEEMKEFTAEINNNLRTED